MVNTFDRSKAAKILEGYESKDWDDETRSALLGELETACAEDSRLSAIKNIVDQELKDTGLYNGTMLWDIYGILQDGLPIPGMLPVEVNPTVGRTVENSVVVSVQGVAAVLSHEEAAALVSTLQDAMAESTDNAEARGTELKKLTGQKGKKRADKSGPADAGADGADPS